MKKQTALQQFIEWGNQMIGDYPAKTLSFYEAIDKAEELLSVEKEQIIDAYSEGSNQNGFPLKHEAEQYYNETYT
jgi:hypothetical protein